MNKLFINTLTHNERKDLLEYIINNNVDKKIKDKIIDLIIKDKEEEKSCSYSTNDD